MSHGAQDAFNQRYNWGSLMVVYPEAKVQFDKKRMQMAIFAKQPKQGRDWQIWVYLVNETSPACEV